MRLFLTGEPGVDKIDLRNVHINPYWRKLSKDLFIFEGPRDPWRPLPPLAQDTAHVAQDDILF